MSIFVTFHVCIFVYVCLFLRLSVSDQGSLVPLPSHEEMAPETTLTLIYWDQNPHDSN